MKEDVLDAFFVLSLRFGNVCKKILCVDNEDLKAKSRDLRRLAKTNSVRGKLVTQKFFKVYYDSSVFDNNGKDFLENPLIDGKNIISEECVW